MYKQRNMNMNEYKHDARHFVETFPFNPLAGPIFHTAIQSALSSNHILLTYIALYCTL